MTLAAAIVFVASAAEAALDDPLLLVVERRIRLDGLQTVEVALVVPDEPERLVGRLTVMVANLKPRKMRFGLSEGMVLAAGGDGGPFLLEPDEGAQPGARVT